MYTCTKRLTACRIDSGTLKRMLKPVHTAPESPVTSPEGGRGRGRRAMMGQQQQQQQHKASNGYMRQQGGR